MRRALALSALLLAASLSCNGPGQGMTTEGDDPEVTAACEELCVEQIACGDTPLDQQTCADACVADVGTPGPDCAAALREMATCAMQSCDDELACQDELAARDAACGGTG